MPMDKAKRASWARALFGKDEEEGGDVLEGAGRMPNIPSNKSAQVRQLMQRQSMAEETKALKALDAALPEAQAAVWQETAPIPTGESWDSVPLDITKDLEEVWGKPTPTGTSQASGQTPEAVATPGDGWKGKQQTDAWVGGGGWSYARINTQDGEIIQATNPKSGKVVEVKPGMKNADGMDLFQLIDVERQNQLTAGSTAPTDEMKRQAEAEIASVTPSKGDMEKAMNGGKVPTPYADARMAQGSAKVPTPYADARMAQGSAEASKPKPVLSQEDMDYLFGSGAAATPALMRGEQAIFEPDQLSSLAERGISKAVDGSGEKTEQLKTMQFNGREYTIDQIGTMQESLNPFLKGITAVDTLTGQPITFQPGTTEFMEAATILAGGTPAKSQTAAASAPAPLHTTSGVFQVDGRNVTVANAPSQLLQVDGQSLIVVGGGTNPLNPGLKAPLMVLDQQTGQAIPQNSPAYAKAIQMAGVK